jgi:hypothetical protein
MVFYQLIVLRIRLVYWLIYRYRSEKLNKNLEMKTTFKIHQPICDSYTHHGLSKYNFQANLIRCDGTGTFKWHFIN